MKVPDQDELAWDLLDSVRAILDIAAINRVSMTMADRDYPAVFELLINRASANDLRLSEELRTRLREWSTFYAGQPLSAHLLRLLEA